MSIQSVEQFLYYEANLIDDRDFEAWVSLFTEDGIYWVPSNNDDMDPSKHVSIIYDNLEGIKDRVWRLGSGLAFAQEPASKTMHQLSNISVEEETDGEVKVRSNVVIYDYRDNHHLRSMDAIVQYPARCQYLLRKSGDSYQIALKKVNLINSNGAMGNVAFIL